jgi:hypothetical protein
VSAVKFVAPSINFSFLRSTIIILLLAKKSAPRMGKATLAMTNGQENARRSFFIEKTRLMRPKDGIEWPCASERVTS